MKNLILISLVAIICWSCTSNNDDTPEGYPSYYYFLFDFKKSDDTNFEHQEVHYRGKYSVINNDTTFGNVDNWNLFEIHQVNEAMQTNGQPPINDYFYKVSIHPSYISEIPTGEEWTIITVNLIKYEGYEDVDEFMIKWYGKFLPNSRELEYLEEEFYLNGEPFDPFYTRYFRIEK